MLHMREQIVPDVHHHPLLHPDEQGPLTERTHGLCEDQHHHDYAEKRQHVQPGVPSHHDRPAFPYGSLKPVRKVTGFTDAPRDLLYAIPHQCGRISEERVHPPGFDLLLLRPGEHLTHHRIKHRDRRTVQQRQQPDQKRTEKTLLPETLQIFQESPVYAHRTPRIGKRSCCILQFTPIFSQATEKCPHFGSRISGFPIRNPQSAIRNQIHPTALRCASDRWTTPFFSSNVYS